MTTNEVKNVENLENVINQEQDLQSVKSIIEAGNESTLMTIGRFDSDSTPEPKFPGVTLYSKSGKYCSFRTIKAPKDLNDLEGVLSAWKEAFVILGAIQKFTMNMKKNGNYKSPLVGFTKANIVIRSNDLTEILDTRKFDQSVSSLALFPKVADLEAKSKERDIKFLCQKHASQMLRAFGANKYVKQVLAAK